MDDRTLLELAAKAAGVGALKWVSDWHGPWIEIEPTPGVFPSNSTTWNPLADDADAFRLMVTLGLVVHVGSDAARALYDGEGCTEEYSGDKAASTRRAIVRAAAEIGARK